MTKVGYNFGKKVLCPLCLNHEDSQEEMLECVILKLQCKELYQKNDEKYDDVFSADINKIYKISKVFQKCFEKRDEMLTPDEDHN